MRKYISTSLLSIVIVLNSFNAVGGIKGVVSNFITGDSISLLNPFVQNALPLEKSVIGKKGEFEFKYNPAEIGYFYLSFSNGKNALIVLSPNNNSVVDIDFSTGRILKTSGSKENEFLKAIADIYYSQGKMEQEKLADIESLFKKTPANFAMTSITDYYRLDKNYFLAINDAIITSLQKIYPQHEMLKFRRSEIDAQKRLAIGFPAPEITMPDPEGKLFSLSSLKGKVVLIDFWASWCRPCRMENPNVVRMYNAYKEHGFDILGVSLDKDKNAWLKAIETDGLVWHHVSDLKYWQSEAGILYDVPDKGIPYTVLINRDGNIVAKGLRGEALEMKIKELLLKE